MSLLRTRLLRVIHPTQSIRTTNVSNQSCITHHALRSQRSPSHQHQLIRSFTPATLLRTPRSPPPSNDQGSVSDDARTEISSLDVLANAPPPTTAVESCLSDGFFLGNGLRIGGGSGCLLVGGEAFEWRPWQVATQQRPMVNAKGQWDVDKEVWALLEVVWPRPGGWESFLHVIFHGSAHSSENMLNIENGKLTLQIF